jgi:hypothetical protein
MQSSFSETQLARRAATIIRSVRVGQVQPTSDALAELAELTEVLSDQPVKPTVIARLTVIRAVGCKTIIEVRDDATFNSFYRFYSQEGNRRSTKRQVRCASRNEGLLPYYLAYRMTPGLEKLAERWRVHPGVVSVKVRIIRKRAYRKLINAAPHELGLTKMARLPLYGPLSVVRHS